jgi:hypothetical protein
MSISASVNHTMSAKTIIDISKPTTQSIEGVKALLSWRGRASDPLPSFVEMGEGGGKVVLVLSNKRDAYYTVTVRECSCPARSWHPGQRCKHQRKHFPEPSRTAQAPQAGYARAAGGRWPGGHNGPVLDDLKGPAPQIPAAQEAA